MTDREKAFWIIGITSNDVPQVVAESMTSGVSTELIVGCIKEVTSLIKEVSKS